MLASDPPPFVTLSGAPCPSKESFPLPEGYKWADEEWRLEGADEGWVYTDHHWKHPHLSMFMSALTRRRRWRRRMIVDDGALAKAVDGKDEEDEAVLEGDDEYEVAHVDMESDSNMDAGTNANVDVNLGMKVE